MARVPGPTRSPVAEEFLGRLLKPYKEHCRYLSRAELETPAGGEDTFVARCHGSFGIPASCYIDDTGHLNSVELNICYNQMLYVLMGKCVEDELAPGFAHWTLESYLERYLPDVLIHDIHTKFKRPIDPRSFEGELTFEDAVDTRKFLYLRTHCRFWDENGGLARGDISVALLRRDSDTGGTE